MAHLEYANGAELRNVGLENWDQDDQYAFTGKHLFLPEGYATLAEGFVCVCCGLSQGSFCFAATQQIFF